MDEIKDRIDEVTEEIGNVQEEIDNFDPEEHFDRNAYDEMLREVYGDRNGCIDICGLQYDVADTLHEIDPTAYRCGYSDYISQIDVEETPKYMGLLALKEELKKEFTELKDAFSEAEEELFDLTEEMED